MKTRLNRLVPMGIDTGLELRWIGGGLLAATLFSLSFFMRYQDAYFDLFRWNGTDKRLIAGAMIPNFYEILGGALSGFLILAVCMIPMAIYHYLYHYRGSKSIYLMKRLPRRRELWRRCLTLPLLTAAAALLIAFLLLLLDFYVYQTATPAVCLPPDQWQKLWDVWMGVS